MVGVYLTDLTFIHDGNPDILPETKMVNFGKCVLISDVLREIQLYQQTKFTQVLNPQFKVQNKTKQNKKKFKCVLTLC
jgi:hypothetical protein